MNWQEFVSITFDVVKARSDEVSYNTAQRVMSFAADLWRQMDQQRKDGLDEAEAKRIIEDNL